MSAEPETTSWSDRLLGGFRRTSEKLGENLTGLFTKAALDKATLDEIEEALIASDLGPTTAARVRERLEGERYDKGLDEMAVRPAGHGVVEPRRRPPRRPLLEDLGEGVGVLHQPRPDLVDDQVDQRAVEVVADHLVEQGAQQR